MPYDIRFRSSAKAELAWLLETYGQDFGKGWEEWTATIAIRSEARDTKGSIEFVKALEDAAHLIDVADKSELIRLFKKRWNDASFWLKIRAAIVTVTKRTPPWQLRYSGRTIYCLGAGVPVDIELLYEVDHAEKRVIIMKIGIADDLVQESDD